MDLKSLYIVFNIKFFIVNLRGGEELEEALGRITSSDLLSSGKVGSELVFSGKEWR